MIHSQALGLFPGAHLKRERRDHMRKAGWDGVSRSWWGKDGWPVPVLIDSGMPPREPAWY